MKKMRILCAAALLCVLPGLALAVETSAPVSATSDGVSETAYAETNNQLLPVTVATTLKEVVEEGDGYLLITVNDQNVQLNIPENFTAISAKDGSLVDWKTLKAGDAVVANYGPQATFSIPPQSPLNYLIVVGNEKAPAGMFTVEEVTEAEDGWQILTNQGSLYITLTKAVWGATAPVKGEQLLAWYDVVMESYPAQAVADKAIRVATETEAEKPAEAQDIHVKVGDNTIAGAVEVVNDVKMVPLRGVAEALGFELTWSEAPMSAHISNGTVQANVVIGKDNYFQSTSVPDADGKYAPAALGAAPYLQNKTTTYVPAKLFELLGFEVTETDGFININAAK